MEGGDNMGGLMLDGETEGLFPVSPPIPPPQMETLVISIVKSVCNHSYYIMKQA